MRRLILCLSAVALITGFIAPSTGFAQQQSINFYIGGFTPRGFDSRGTDDVLFQNANFLTFNVKDFNGATVGGEWLVGLTDLFDAGLGLGYYQRTTPSVYTNLTFADQTEIEQELKLRIVPFTATIRFLPLGHHGPIQPYIGGGVGVMRWRYSETGDFVDTTDNSIFRDTFIGTGTSVGPLILGGVTFPIGAVGVGGEIRYQSAKGTLPPAENFAGPKIDLGGMNYLFMVSVRF
jgi:hypothetical protein